ncbi:MAG: hypothetical protein A2068_07870 [Ignavibacteria bacterium GWB2_35_6b]|nr:MAG: hypothetical protein A2068_07870 [Ignavibacteria bacterium GWB2_35_6b]
MKNISKIIKSSFMASLLIFLFSCSEGDPIASLEKEVKFNSYQISGCNHNLFGKKSTADSCFVYSFDDKLEIDFCVPGNCCPDSNRFVTNYELNSDTLFLSVTDTAANLCRCMCNYIIHAEISGLHKDKYIFYCNIGGRIIYNEQIRKL